MKNFVRFVITWLMTCQMFAAPSASRKALVIGNEKYASPAGLDCSANDARRMSEMLRQCGFEVTELHDLKGGAFQTELQKFGSHLAEGGIAFVYYSGHGMQSNGTNYLVPVDADFSGDYVAGSMELGAIFKRLEEASTAVNIVVLDCCRNNVAVPKTKSVLAGLAKTEPPANTVLAFATTPGKFALDGTAPGPGPYATALIRHLSRPGLEIIQAVRNAGLDVEKATDKQQKPTYESDLNEMFYLQPKSGELGDGGSFPEGEEESSALSFARRFLAADESNDAGSVLQFYAPNVDSYFGTANVKKRQILDDRKKGIAASAERHYKLERPPVISRSEGDGTQTVICERICEFKTSPDAPAKVRPSHVAFKVKPLGDSWQIVYIAAHQPAKDEPSKKAQNTAAFDRAALGQFLISFDSADAEDDPAVGMKFFDSTVSQYFKIENPGLSDILADRKAGRLRWPTRHYRPQSYRVVEVRPGSLRVEYSTNYEHSNPATKKQAEGVARNVLTLKIVDEHNFKITAIQAVPKP